MYGSMAGVRTVTLQVQSTAGWVGAVRDRRAAKICISALGQEAFTSVSFDSHNSPARCDSVSSCHRQKKKNYHTFESCV